MEDIARIVADVYSSCAAGYDEHWASVLAKSGRRLASGLELSEDARVLDLGTGVGRLLPHLRTLAPSGFVAGADRAEGMIRLAPGEFPRALADARALPFAGESFDAVVMAFVLFHVPEPARAVREVHRALRPGGKFAAGTWTAGVEDFPANAIWIEEMDRHGAPPLPDPGPGRDATNSPQKMRDMLGESGFEDVRSEIHVVDDPMTVDVFLERRSTLGFMGRRFAGMPPEAQAECLRAARERLQALSRDELTSREEAILTWARKRG